MPTPFPRWSCALPLLALLCLLPITAHASNDAPKEAAPESTPENTDTAYLKQMLDFVEDKAEHGSSEAMFSLGVAYFTGDDHLGIPKDMTIALKWLERAASAGYIEAQGFLGEVYNSDQYGVQDYARARYWYERIITANDPAHPEETGEAFNNLAELYRLGHGVGTDYAKALTLYTKALDYPSIRNYANYNIGEMYELGQGVKQDYVTARQWYEKSAEEHMGHAEQRLGWFYQKGLGVTADKSRARQWYQKACADNYQQACQGG